MMTIQLWTVEISDSELLPEDDCGSEYAGSTSGNEISGYTSEHEDIPLPRIVLRKKNKNEKGSNNK